MPLVYVSIGSNIQQEAHILACLDAMAEAFGELTLSSVYESEAVGFEGDNFFNLVAGFDTELSVGELARLLRQIETDNGRRRDGPKFSARTLDIDILTYGEACGTLDGVDLPREEILDNAFVLLPLAEIAPETPHPRLGKSYRAIWAEYGSDRQKLWPIDFVWRGKVLSMTGQ